MNFRQITPFFILMIFIAVMLQVGCDTLVTENNTIILVDSTLAIGCFSCHNDEDNLLERPSEQFKNSAHANSALLDIRYDISGEKCGDKCHTHQGFLKDVDSSITSYGGTSTISCYTCHLPHTGDYGTWDIDTLRASDKNIIFVSGFGADLDNSNSCAHCHSATQAVDIGSDVIFDEDFGPHVSPQADILTGRNGYFINIAEPKVNKHSNNGCINCHFGTYGEGQGYIYAEHTFKLEDENSLQQFTKTCNVSGCHNDEMTDFYDSDSIRYIDSLADSTISLLASYEIIDGTDTSGLTYTVGNTVPRIHAEAYYNYLLFKNDRSRGIHNIRFVTDLLDTTINVLDSLPPVTLLTIIDSLGCFGQSVTFTPVLLGAYDSLYWDLGNGQIDTTTSDTSLTTIYATPGTYYAELISVSLWNADSMLIVGSDTTFPSYIAASRDTLVRTVIIDDAPIADFTADDDSVCVGDEIAFTSAATHLLPASMIWDFGDGDSAFVPEPTHAYSTAGTYSVSLEVTTNCGIDNIIKVDLITILANPIAAFTFVTTDDLTYEFTDTSTDAVSWDWKFITGIGTELTTVDSSTAQNPTYTFTNPDVTKRATLRVINSNGCSDTTYTVIYVPPIE